MFSYLIKRLSMVIPLLLGITFFTFLILKNLPGDAVTNLIAERSSPEIIEELRQKLGTDKPFLMQYLGYLNLLLSGNMGKSLINQRDVAEEIKKKLPNTIKLTFLAMAFAIPLGITIGFISGYSKDPTITKILDSLTICALSFPVFWIGLILIIIFSLTLKVLPPSGTGALQYLILPAVTLSIPAIGNIARITKISISEVLHMPYILTAHAKGLPPLRLKILHILKNAIIPIVTIIGLDIGSYLNGAVVTETIFGWDGIGKYTMEGIIRRDYPVILGCVLVGTTIFVIINTLTDICYHILDPRIRHEIKRG
ncbi:MAG: ABC transporter permease [Thermodesulfovibrionales bacterium]|nr:ABC transporter permease [Thermodesulfovibrionales bacterium]